VDPQEWAECVRLTGGPNAPRHLRGLTAARLTLLRATPADNEPDSPEQAEMVRGTARAARDTFTAELFTEAMRADQEAAARDSGQVANGSGVSKDQGCALPTASPPACCTSTVPRPCRPGCFHRADRKQHVRTVSPLSYLPYLEVPGIIPA
jgi:hypothetical protein